MRRAGSMNATLPPRPAATLRSTMSMAALYTRCVLMISGVPLSTSALLDPHYIYMTSGATGCAWGGNHVVAGSRRRRAVHPIVRYAGAGRSVRGAALEAIRSAVFAVHGDGAFSNAREAGGKTGAGAEGLVDHAVQL